MRTHAWNTRGQPPDDRRRHAGDGSGDVNFVDAIAVLRRHKLLVVYGLLVACLLATFSAYRLDGTSLVSRTRAGCTSPRPWSPCARAPSTRPRPSRRPPCRAPADGRPGRRSPLPPRRYHDDGGRATARAALGGHRQPGDVLHRAVAEDHRRVARVSPKRSRHARRRWTARVTAVVAQDTNTMDIVVDGSTPAIAADHHVGGARRAAVGRRRVLGDAGHPVRPRRRRDQRPVGAARRRRRSRSR